LRGRFIGGDRIVIEDQNHELVKVLRFDEAVEIS
jgi:hypothetical protein